jgi:hypothetical protein
MGLRLGPQPPTPIVIPLFSRATMSAAFINLFMVGPVGGYSHAL